MTTPFLKLIELKQKEAELKHKLPIAKKRSDRILQIKPSAYGRKDHRAILHC